LLEGETKSGYAIVWSLLIHSILLVVIIIQVNLGAQRKKEFFENNISIKKTVKTSIVVLTNPVKIKKEKIVELEATQIRTINEEKVVEKTTTETTVENKTEKKLKESVAKKTKELSASESSKDIINDESQTSKLTQKIIAKKSVLMKSRQILQQKNRAAPTYQVENENASMSVMNNTLSQHRYNPIEEKTLKQKLDIKITCDSVASKTTAVLSGLFGGRINCESRPDLSPFIKQKQKQKQKAKFKYKLD